MIGDGARLIVVHGVTAATWTKRYGVVPWTHPCQTCGRELTTSWPYASGCLRGLIAPPCACGHFGTPYVVVWPDGFRARKRLTKKEIRKRPKCPVLPFRAVERKATGDV